MIFSLFLDMQLFDFHHHKKHYAHGIYNLNLLETPPETPFSVGIHPMDISENWEQNFLWLKEISQSPKCLAIGECGLDGLITTGQELQEKVFRQQIFWANELRKPVIVHCVKRFSELMKFTKIAKIPMIIHGFNKKKNIIDELLRAGFYFSFGKASLHNVSLQKIIEEMPTEKIFLETDNAEFKILELYQKVSVLKNISVEILNEKIKENTQRITNIKQK